MKHYLVWETCSAYAEAYAGCFPSSCSAYAEAYVGDLCIKQVAVRYVLLFYYTPIYLRNGGFPASDGTC